MVAMTMQFVYFAAHVGPEGAECEGSCPASVEASERWPDGLCDEGKKLYQEWEDSKVAQAEWEKTAPRKKDGSIDWNKIKKGRTA